jgi:hypothetical protein
VLDVYNREEGGEGNYFGQRDMLPLHKLYPINGVLSKYAT